jgi:multidrug efflux pump subunit AcrA (membrane-fusion protein)
VRRNSLAGQILSLIVSVLIVAAGIFGFCALYFKPEVEASSKAPAPVPIVNTEVILPHDDSLKIAVDGVVVPFRAIEVAAEVAGKVVYKDDACDGGRFVLRDTTLIKIDPRDYANAVKRFENQLDQAVAKIEELQVEIKNTDELIKIAEDQLKLEENELSRLAGLIQERIVTDSSMDQAKQAELAARNGLVLLKNQRQLLTTRQRGLESARELVVTDLEKAKLDLERTEIIAAVDGVVVDDFVERDSFVQKGEPLFTLQDTSAFEVKCRLKMNELSWVWRHTGREPKGREDDLSGYQIPQTPVTISYHLADRQDVHYEWKGVLARFEGSGLDEATRTVPCRVRVDNPRDVAIVRDGGQPSEDAKPSVGPPTLVSGMYVQVSIEIVQPSPLLQIPEQAVQPGKTVWVVNDGRLEEKKTLDLIERMTVPREGVPDGVPCWIVEAAGSGLAAGDHVVVPPFGVLRDGIDVREREDESP